MTAVTCKGITSKGNQCKLPVKNHNYCRHHINQDQLNKSSAVRRSSPKKNGHEKSGFIYVYTLRLLLDKKGRKLWLKVRNLPGVGSKHRDEWVDFNTRKSSFIIIKIGMTTHSVAFRLKQWEAKCHHELSVMHPRSLESDRGSLSRLIDKLRNLNIQETRRLQTYRHEDSGFHCKKSLQYVELEVHKIMRAKYGYGDVLCLGCNVSDGIKKTPKGSALTASKNQRDHFSDGYNIHIEWFLIPRKDLDLVLNMIDSVCFQLGN
ncbi:uncharacterized protein PRCAT00002717001 [Priceomyces carsonii]|uniref:uncharacterized protein n=1 Tax=Priceomyces carsonii TaxID=28549 RepID=UPI002EDA5DD0|nr:unnamed protein product [Priceomyces carsonii]